ncbi:hypothetical protein A4G20_05000 [Pasteurellaceae bacterium RH1A]|nr:hypothetical protein A4G20_05000 [Pasteurellaceae bacterium RH1A]
MRSFIGLNVNRLIAEQGLQEILADFDKPVFDLHILYLAHRHPSALVKAFVEFCLARVGRDKL